MNGALAIMVEHPKSESGILQVLHGIAKLAVPAFCRQTFACVGDIQRGHIETVEFSNMLLRITGEGRIFMDPQLQIKAFASAALAGEELHLAHVASVVNTKTVKTRPAMFLPCPLVAHVIDQDPTACEAPDRLLPIIKDLRMEGECQPLLDWLLIASTNSRGRTSLTHPPAAGTAPLGMRQVHAERNEDILFQQLPTLQLMQGNTDPAVLQTLQATQEQCNAVTANMEDQTADRERERAPKTVEERWPNHCNRLLKLCHTNVPEQPPEFWQRAEAWKWGGGTAT